jgi:NTP pyrophosphatase (non-canonical NTP hydrolase)
MTFEEFELKVVQWAKDRMIFNKSTDRDQLVKLGEEFVELIEHITLKPTLKVGDSIGILDSIGDMLVVLTIIAHFNDYDLKMCYETAYNEIKAKNFPSDTNILADKLKETYEQLILPRK